MLSPDFGYDGYRVGTFGPTFGPWSENSSLQVVTQVAFVSYLITAFCCQWIIMWRQGLIESSIDWATQLFSCLRCVTVGFTCTLHYSATGDDRSLTCHQDVSAVISVLFIIVVKSVKKTVIYRPLWRIVMCDNSTFCNIFCKVVKPVVFQNRLPFLRNWFKTG